MTRFLKVRENQIDRDITDSCINLDSVNIEAVKTVEYEAV